MDSSGSTLLDPSQQHSSSLSTYSNTLHRNHTGGHQTGSRDFSICSSVGSAAQKPSMRQQLISVSDQARSLGGGGLIGQEQNKSDQTRQDAALASQAAPGKSHSVGPVMGIFFKVWSLVKGKSSKENVPRSSDAPEMSLTKRHLLSPSHKGPPSSQSAAPPAERRQSVSVHFGRPVRGGRFGGDRCSSGSPAR